MRAIVFDGPGRPLRAETRPIPEPEPGQLLLKVGACGVCRTDLHLLDGELAVEALPRVLGHQIVGSVEKLGASPNKGTEPADGQATPHSGTETPGRQATRHSGTETPGRQATPHNGTETLGGQATPGRQATPHKGTETLGGQATPGRQATPHSGTETLGRQATPARGETRSPVQGERVGVPWLGWTCGECEWCRSGRENLCPWARFTGRDIDGGMAEYAVADARYCFPIPDGYPDEQAAPLLCAGLIGWRSLRMCGEGRRLGLYGFGAAAHIVAQVAAWQGREVFALTRPGDTAAQRFALELGAVWAGGSDEDPPEQLEAAILFAPDGALVPRALRALQPGGTVVCGGIHMSDIPSFPYEILWGERCLRSVANLTRGDALEFLALAPAAGVRTRVTRYPLEDAEPALRDLRAGRFNGAAVLVP